MTQDGTSKDDVKVPEGELGKQIEEDFEAGKDLIISVVSAMGEEMALTVKVRSLLLRSSWIWLMADCILTSAGGSKGCLEGAYLLFALSTYALLRLLYGPLSCSSYFSRLRSFLFHAISVREAVILNSCKVVQACTKKINKRCRNIGIIAFEVFLYRCANIVKRGIVSGVKLSVGYGGTIADIF